jgi:hypothetical protein
MAGATIRREGSATGWLLERIARVEVPPSLLRDILLDHADLPQHRPGSPAAHRVVDAVVSRVASHSADVVLAARVRVRALAYLLHDRFLRGAPADEADVILLRDDMFLAASIEPLIMLTDGDIGFDPDGLHSRLLRLADTHGAA